MDEMPKIGWAVSSVTGRAALTGDPLSPDPTVARLSEVRRRVMTAVGRALDPPAKLLGVHPEAFPPNLAWSATGRRPVAAGIRRVRPDVVIATSPPPAALFAAGPLAARHGIPFVADLRDNWAGHPAYDAGGDLLRRLEARALRRAAAVVCVTDGMEERLRALHPWLTDRLHVLPNGFAPNLLNLRRERTFRGRRATVIHAGALFADRSARELIVAASDPRVRDRVRLVLHGNIDAETASALAAAPADLNVELVPPLPWAQSIELVAAADIAVVIVPPGLGDDVAWPVKMLEALALGMPILSMTSGGAAEQLLRGLGQDLGCARHDDAADAAAALIRLLDTPPPPAPEERLARWNRAAVTARYVRLLDSLVTN
jgi:glycosyltransferase involved in cell wall biosynthesis